MPHKFMLYGPAGAGKTTFAISSFWDFREQKIIPGTDGRLLLFGSEGNDALGIPEDKVRRFPYNPKKPLDFYEQFVKYLETIHAAALQGKGPTSIVVDSLSELSQGYIDAYEEENEAACAADKWTSWRAWRRQYRLIDRLLGAQTLHADIFYTAHVREVRETVVTSRGKEMKGDAAWLQEMQIGNIPSIEGKAKEEAPHNFDFIVYMKPTSERRVTDAGFVETPLYQSFWLPIKDYLTKNKFGHLWGNNSGMQESIMFADFKNIIEGIQKGNK